MKKIYHKFLIASTVFILVGGVYLYFSESINSNNIVPRVYGSDLASSSGEISPLSPSETNGSASLDVSFLASLTGLKGLKIDTSLFTNKAFTLLKDNSVKIEPVLAGRQNPFSAMGSDTIANNNQKIASSGVVTNQASQITEITATLNGTVNTSTGVTDLYFEYGLDQNLGTTTSIVNQSMVGTFIKNIESLTPQTTYFFQACAKINSKKSCGEMLSFTTN